VFLTASEGDTRVTLAYDALTGRQLWRREIKCERTHKIFKVNDPASPTPAADDHAVYVFFPDFGLISYTFDGEERWRRVLGPFNNFYGMATSPVVAQGLVLLLCDQQSGSYLIGVDKETGRDRWRTERPGATLGWSVPAVHSPPKGPADIITFGSTRVDSYSLATGEPRWWMPIGSDGSMGSPLIFGDTAIVTANGHDEPWMPTFDSTLAKYDKDGDGRISHDEFKEDKDWSLHFGWIDSSHDGFIDAREWNTARTFGLGDYGVMAIPLAGKGQLSSKALRWRFKRNLAYIPAPLIYDSVFYMVRTGGIVTSLDPATGALLKQGRTEKAPGEYYASPVAADGKIFLVSEEGKVSVLKAAPQWEVLAVNSLEEETYATPAISGGRIYVRTRGTMYCFGQMMRPASAPSR
jgi:outer membrane protein assembly factor BamB